MPRKSAPWWRTNRQEWYSTVRGKQVRLGVFDPNDRAAAEAALVKIEAALPPATRTAEGVARRVFAFAVCGLSADGEDALPLLGSLAAADESAARAEVEGQLSQMQAMAGPQSPRLRVRIWVWEVLASSLSGG